MFNVVTSQLSLTSRPNCRISCNIQWRGWPLPPHMCYHVDWSF